jgi:hypothetical protein
MFIGLLIIIIIVFCLAVWGIVDGSINIHDKNGNQVENVVIIIFSILGLGFSSYYGYNYVRDILLK